MTQYYNTQFGAFLKVKFGTIEAFADFMNVSLPTARHYAHKPHNMRIMDFIRISEKLEIEAKELFNLIRNESNTNL